ncbi:MAG: ABC transporter substrate-binding protein [Candidatus Binatia bacterium]
MEKLFLTVACGDYDRTKPLQDGSVEPEGIKLNYLALQSEEIFWRMGNYREFDASEMSLSNHITIISRGDSPFVGIPIFPSRFFRHSSVFFNVESGIKKPEDFRGKKVGTPEYAMTAAVWIRGFFHDDYGVRAQDVQWFVGGQEEPGRKERVKLELPPEIKLAPIPADKTLNAMLESGEIDALISARIPSCFANGSRQVQRLFPNYKEVEIEYYKRSTIFPIMHILVVRKDVYDRYPWVARSLYKAFCEAKDRAMQTMHISNSHACTLPWLSWEREQLREIFGPDWWPYGVEANRHVLESLIRYMGEQGLLKKPVKVEDIFAPSSLGEFKL